MRIYLDQIDFDIMKDFLEHKMYCEKRVAIIPEAMCTCGLDSLQRILFFKIEQQKIEAERLQDKPASP